MSWKKGDASKIKKQNKWSSGDASRINNPEVNPSFYEASKIKPELTPKPKNTPTPKLIAPKPIEAPIEKKGLLKTTGTVLKNVDDFVMRSTDSALLGLPDRAGQLGGFIGDKLASAFGRDDKSIADKNIRLADELQAQKDSIGGKIGNVAGYIAPGSASSKLAGKIPLIGKLAPKIGQSATRKVLQKGLQAGTQEAIAGTGMALTEGLIKGDNLKDATTRVRDYGLIGGVAGGVFGGLGQGISQFRQGRKLTNQLKDIDRGYDAISDSFNLGNRNIPTNRIDDAIPTPRPMQQPIRQSVDNIINQPTAQAPKPIVKAGTSQANNIQPYKMASFDQPTAPTKQASNVIPETSIQSSNPNAIKMSQRSANTMSDGNVGKRQIKAFQQDYPEAKPYIQNYADWVLGREFVENANYDRITPIMKTLKDETGLQPKQIKDGLERLIKDAGAENAANAKKVEVIIDDMLTNGFESSVTGKMPPDVDYLKLKSQIEGKQIIPQSRSNALDDATIDDLVNISQQKIAERSNASIKFDSIKTADQLPTTQKGLEQYVKQVDKAIAEGLEFDMQMFTEAKGRLKDRKFISNSMMNSPVVPDDMKQAFKQDMPQYETITNKETWAHAVDRVKHTPDESLSDFMTMDKWRDASDTALGEALIVKAIQNGDITQASRLSVTLAERLTAAGQEIQAAAMMKKMTPEGMLLFGQRQMGKAVNPKDAKTLNETVSKIKEVINQAKKESDRVIDGSIDDIFGDIFGDVTTGFYDDVTTVATKSSGAVTNFSKMLQDKISKRILPKNAKEKSLVKEIIGDLFEEAKGVTKAGKKPLTLPNDDLRRLGNSYKFTDWGKNIRNKAKTLLKDEFKDDPDMLLVLDEYFKTNKVVSNKKLLDQVLNRRLSGLQGKATASTKAPTKESINKWVKNWYQSGRKSKEKFIDSIANETGLKYDEAKKLRDTLESRLGNDVKATKEKIITAMGKTKKVTKRTELDRLMEQINVGVYDDSIDETIRSAAKEKLNLPDLKKDDVEFILKNMSKASKLADGRKKDILVAQTLQSIANKIPTSAGEKTKALQRISLLLNPKTVGRNIAGNVIFGGLDNISNTGSAGIDKVVGKFTGKRTASLPSLKGQAKSMKQNIKTSLEDFKLGIDTSPSATQYEIPRTKKIFNQDRVDEGLKNKGLNLIGKGLNKAHDLTSFSLRVGDTPFYQAAYDDVLRQQLKANKVAKPTQEMIETATRIAQERTYQDINGLTKMFIGMQKSLNLGKEVGVGNIVLPFTKTPANILKRSIEYTPLGLEKATREGIKLLKDGTFNQRAFVDSISRSVTGSGMIYLGYELAKAGRLTGAYNKDRDVGRLETDTGKLPYAWKNGDTYTTYDWALPASMPIAIGADIFLGGKDKKDVDTVVMDAINSGGQTLFKQSLLQGMGRFFGGYDPMDSMTKTIGRAPSMFAPTALSQINRLADPKPKETYSPNWTMNNVINPIRARLPFNNLPNKVNTLGEEVTPYNRFNTVLNPATTRKFEPNNVESEVLRLHEATGEKDHFPKVANKTINTIDPKTKKKLPIQLSGKEFTEYQRLLGEKTQQEFDRRIKSSVYENMSDEAKVKSLKKVLGRIKTEAEKEFLKERNKLNK